MTLESLTFSTFITKFQKILKTLNRFKGNYSKQFNFSKLMEILQLSREESDQIIDLILLFQDLYTIIFKDYHIKKIMNGETNYLIAINKGLNRESSDEEEKVTAIGDNISLSQNQARLLSDLIHTFKFVERGRGFDLHKNGSEILKEIRVLKERYPMLFIENGNHLTYPSELTIKYGELLLAYGISNRKSIDDIEIKYKFNVKEK